ncbi:putative helix-turn-helix domain-containing protein [Roseibium sp. TrichSKD4]|uniref:helix-turn-helix domain-containing protein n=1 Tax=Roseibium sp. TrichSKD4 TaxID=744980 RepID=UPI0001E56B58|nr:helix-turn-helix transcriptional regulator [Roseibium sp. TrichSKD4]EFO30132.1 putative helix-turn-helix domain-containing protein [Roseibium sp. TrichSKD4]
MDNLLGTDFEWGLRVRKFRSRWRLTREELAKETGVSHHIINRIERGEVRAPRGNKGALIANFFNVSEEYLKTGKAHSDGDPPYDILDQWDEEEKIVFKPDSPYAPTIKLTATEDNPSLEQLKHDLAKKYTKEISDRAFQGKLGFEEGITIYGILFETLKEFQKSFKD